MPVDKVQGLLLTFCVNRSIAIVNLALGLALYKMILFDCVFSFSLWIRIQ